MINDYYIHIQLSSSLILSSFLFSIFLEGIGISQLELYFPVFLISGIIYFIYGLAKLIDEPFEDIYKELPKIYSFNFFKWLMICVFSEFSYILAMIYLS